MSSRIKVMESRDGSLILDVEIVIDDDNEDEAHAVLRDVVVKLASLLPRERGERS